jgi:hypothetical protein
MIDSRMEINNEIIDRLVRIQHPVRGELIELPNGPVENRYRLVTSGLSPKHSNTLHDRISSTTKSGAAIPLKSANRDLCGLPSEKSSVAFRIMLSSDPR